MKISGIWMDIFLVVVFLSLCCERSVCKCMDTCFSCAEAQGLLRRGECRYWGRF